jgi:hypothetical protein
MSENQHSRNAERYIASARYRELLPLSQETIRRSRELIDESKRLIEAHHKHRATAFRFPDRQE